MKTFESLVAAKQWLAMGVLAVNQTDGYKVMRASAEAMTYINEKTGVKWFIQVVFDRELARGGELPVGFDLGRP